MSYREIVRDQYREGELCPWWKGYVYRDYARWSVVVAPIGFNVLYRWIYGMWLWMRIGNHDVRRFISEQLEIRKL